VKVKLIDVTLRESVHVPNVPLTIEDAKETVHGLSLSGIDYIEIGYVAESNTEAYLASYSPIEYINILANSIAPGSKSQLVLMLHPSNYNGRLLTRMLHPAVGMVRLCIPMTKVDQSVSLIKELKNNGLSVSANLIRASHASIAEILVFLEKIESAGADFMYLADSNGAMLPSEVYKVYSIMRKHSGLILGFHPHNNLHLAPANALEAIRAGASIIDGSIYGFGKGAGNLCIESFVACMKRVGIKGSHDLGTLIGTSNRAYKQFIAPIDGGSYFIEEEGILTGYHNLNLDMQDQLEKMAKSKDMSLLELLVVIEKQTWVDRAQMVLHHQTREDSPSLILI
jgi:4-hydroxy 2-oxovalerate aldolase